jgi:hypothetical protein
MRLKVVRGELGLALLFAAVGVLWMVKGARMPLWEGFAPNSGFLPLIYGGLLSALAGVVFVHEWRRPAPDTADNLRKPFTVVAALTVAVVALPYAGFVPSVFGLLLFLYARVERLPWRSSVIASAGTAGFLYLIFKVWLGVPLP